MISVTVKSRSWSIQVGCDRCDAEKGVEAETADQAFDEIDAAGWRRNRPYGGMICADLCPDCFAAGETEEDE